MRLRHLKAALAVPDRPDPDVVRGGAAALGVGFDRPKGVALALAGQLQVVDGEEEDGDSTAGS